MTESNNNPSTSVGSNRMVGDGRIDKTPGYMQVGVPISDWVELNQNPNAGIGVNNQGDYCLEVQYTHDGSISLDGILEMVTRKCGYPNVIDAITAAKEECKWWRDEMEKRKSPTAKLSRHLRRSGNHRNHKISPPVRAT